MDPMQRHADPLADDTIALILGEWVSDAASISSRQRDALGYVNRTLATWTSNTSLDNPTPLASPLTKGIDDAMLTYVQRARQLPTWVDTQKIERAEEIFLQDGPLSCTLLFCASLPECYVMPNLADVLHAAGQLEAHTDYRVRATAAMIFPVMLPGGLTHATGAGVAQILKVRLIHAMIRNLILHGNPSHVQGVVPAQHERAAAGQSMHDALAAHGWDVSALGMPCNQTELAYTLLTFHYVFLRALRTLNLALPPNDEHAYLHTWNVMAHVLGVRDELMPHSMQEAQAQFERLQATSELSPGARDVRPLLGQALMATLRQEIRVPIVRDFPPAMTIDLCGAANARDIGILPPSLGVRVLYRALMLLIGAIDRLARLFMPQFSLARALVRIVGSHLVTRLLLSQTRPLQLPVHLLNQIEQTAPRWHRDPRAPGWLHAIELRFGAGWDNEGARQRNADA